MEVNNKLIQDLSRLAKLKFDEKSAEKFIDNIKELSSGNAKVKIIEQ